MNFCAIARWPLQIDGFDLLAFPRLKRMAHFMDERTDISFISCGIAENSNAAFVRRGSTKCAGLFSFSIFEIDQSFAAHSAKMCSEARRNFIEEMLGIVKLLLNGRNTGWERKLRMVTCIPGF